MDLSMPSVHKRRIEESSVTLKVEIEPHHLFRYPSEWDPRLLGRSKGGYLDGRILLPKGLGNLRVVLSTCPVKPHSFDDQEAMNIHPTLIHVVRKGRGNRRLNEKEPVPNPQHWQRELFVINDRLFIRNQTSEVDEQRYADIEKIPELDELFQHLVHHNK